MLESCGGTIFVEPHQQSALSIRLLWLVYLSTVGPVHFKPVVLLWVVRSRNHYTNRGAKLDDTCASGVISVCNCIGTTHGLTERNEWRWNHLPHQMHGYTLGHKHKRCKVREFLHRSPMSRGTNGITEISCAAPTCEWCRPSNPMTTPRDLKFGIAS